MAALLRAVPVCTGVNRRWCSPTGSRAGSPRMHGGEPNDVSTLSIAHGAVPVCTGVNRRRISCSEGLHPQSPYARG